MGVIAGDTLGGGRGHGTRRGGLRGCTVEHSAGVGGEAARLGEGPMVLGNWNSQNPLLHGMPPDAEFLAFR
jgi:hypothetical protein